MCRRMALVVVVGMLVACGGTSGGSGDSGPRRTPRSGSPSAQQVDAAAIVGRLQSSGLPITNVEVYTAANDPNKLLGRPGQYVSKANWQDKRDSDARAIYTVETFAAVQDRDKRLEYVHGLSSSVALLAEYEYAHGLTLLRVSHDLTPDQATAYDNAVRAIVKS